MCDAPDEETEHNALDINSRNIIQNHHPRWSFLHTTICSVASTERPLCRAVTVGNGGSYQQKLISYFFCVLNSSRNTSSHFLFLPNHWLLLSLSSDLKAITFFDFMDMIAKTQRVSLQCASYVVTLHCIPCKLYNRQSMCAVWFISPWLQGLDFKCIEAAGQRS